MHWPCLGKRRTRFRDAWLRGCAKTRQLSRRSPIGTPRLQSKPLADTSSRQARCASACGSEKVENQSRRQTMSLSKKRWQNYIGGEWHDPAAGDWIEIEDPATAEPAFSAPRGQKVDIDAAVSAARKAIDSRAVYEMAPHDRMILLLKVAAELRKMADE